MQEVKQCPKCKDEHFKKGSYCSRKCANSRTWTKEDKEKKSQSAKSSSKVNIANQIYRAVKKTVTMICPICSAEFYTVPSVPRIFCSLKCSLKDTEYKYRKVKGGYRKGSGVGKKGRYKSYWCDSSWELAWVIYHLDHCIKFERNTEGFEYIHDNKKYKYYPDFTKDGIFYEIKGYMDSKCESKIKSFKGDIQILFKEDLFEIFSYVTDKYGNNFIDLYE